MALPKNINLYKPVQPSAKSMDGVSYAEFAPAPALSEFIYCYWHLRSSDKLDKDFTYSVAADGCIDIFFELGNPEESFVMGFSRTVTEFSLGQSFSYFGIRFLPAAFARLFRIPATELTGTFASLGDVVPVVAAFIAARVAQHAPPEQAKLLLDAWFLSMDAHNTAMPDPRFYNALSTIIQSKGMLEVEQLDTGISPRQLRRMFDYHVGASAKAFSRVVRFQNVLAAMSGNDDTKSWLDFGYHDQAHFIKEFREFYGVTPGKV